MASLDVLADPLRLRLVRHLAEHEAATLGELAEIAGVHVNTLRPHVVLLEREGVLVRLPSVPEGRGRPTVRYRLAADRTPPGADFLGLAQVLAQGLAATNPKTGVIDRAARLWGRSQPVQPGRPEVSVRVASVLQRLGFHVRVGELEIELTGCPCPLVAPDRPQLVCRLADGVVDGALVAAGGTLRVAARAHDPEQRRCALVLEPAGSAHGA